MADDDDGFVSLRDAARNLLRLRRDYPDTFRRVMPFLTVADIETLRELAEDTKNSPGREPGLREETDG